MTKELTKLFLGDSSHARGSAFVRLGFRNYLTLKTDPVVLYERALVVQQCETFQLSVGRIVVYALKMVGTWTDLAA